MNLTCQHSAIEELKNLAHRDRHSLLIEGVSGCGKTYLSKQYAKYLEISDFVNVNSTVNDIRKSIDTCYNIDSNIVVCIENLDNGVLGASYTLLKFLEEPRDNVYIIITCSNLHKIPDTIISRSSVVTVSVPTESDLELVSREYPIEKQKILRDRPGIWNAIKNMKDLDYCMKISSNTYFDHLEDLPKIIQSKKPISDVVWSLGHYPDNTDVPIEFAIKCIISNTSSLSIRNKGIQCIKELTSSRLASHAVLSRFVMDCKYGE